MQKSKQASSRAISSNTLRTTTRTQIEGFDWFAVSSVLVIAAVFALLTRFHGQPSTSLFPIAILSASGCGLLVTAIRKLRTLQRPGLFEAAVSGLFLALFQFFVALSYPNVIGLPGSDPRQAQEFFSTWAVLVIFTILFSVVGAFIGHLAFAPAIPKSPKKNGKSASNTTLADPANLAEDESETTSIEEGSQASGTMNSTSADTGKTRQTFEAAHQGPSLPHLVISSLLIGFLPTVVGYVFSAAYDYTLGLLRLDPGPYPTLRLLSGFLPWQIPHPFDLSGARSVDLMTMLWRVPLFLGNPTTFDNQALEPLVFNGLALGLLLLLSQGIRMQELNTAKVKISAFLALEGMMGLMIVLPAALWINQGLEGLLQVQGTAIPIRTLTLLDPLSLTLNLLSGPFLCILLGLLLWNQRHRKLLTA